MISLDKSLKGRVFGVKVGFRAEGFGQGGKLIVHSLGLGFRL